MFDLIHKLGRAHFVMCSICNQNTYHKMRERKRENEIQEILNRCSSLDTLGKKQTNKQTKPQEAWHKDQPR